MKLLVAGKTGQIARSLVEAGASSSFQVVAVGRPDLDLTDRKSIERVLDRANPRIVINAAAYTAVDRAEEDAERADAVNHVGARALAAACAKRDIPLVHLSTDYVFDGLKAVPYSEEDAPAPLGIYGLSKLAGEQAVSAAHPRHVIVRTSWVYSPFGHNFLKTMLQLAAGRKEVRVVDDQHGCPSYAPHLAEALLLMAERLTGVEGPGSPSGTYHLAASGETTWFGFACEIFARSKALGGAGAKVSPISMADYPTLAPRPANSRLDCTKLHDVFGITLPHWREGAAACVRRMSIGGHMS